MTGTRRGRIATGSRRCSCAIARRARARASRSSSSPQWIADVPVGPGSALEARTDVVLPPAPRLASGTPVQVLSRVVEHERTEGPRAYPDNDEVLRIRAAIWVNDVPGFGIDPIPLGRPPTASRFKVRPVVVTRDALSNGRLLVRIADDGAVTLEQDDRTLINLLEWESRADIGDLYTPAIRDEKLTPRLIASRVLHRGPLRGAIEQRWRAPRQPGTNRRSPARHPRRGGELVARSGRGRKRGTRPPPSASLQNGRRRRVHDRRRGVRRGAARAGQRSTRERARGAAGPDRAPPSLCLALQQNVGCHGDLRWTDGVRVLEWRDRRDAAAIGG